MKYSIIKIGNVKDDDLNGKSFVGVSRNLTPDTATLVMPYGIDMPDMIDGKDKENVRFLKKYVKVIQKALNSDLAKERLESKDGIQNPLAAVNLLHDYLSFGELIEYEIVSTKSDRGKIDFNQTIKKIRPTISNGQVFFDEFITRRKIVDEDNFTARVQGSVINHFMEHGGEVLFGQSVSVPVNEVKLNDTTIVKLRKELMNTFNSRKENIIRWGISYIEGMKNLDEKEKGSWNYAIIASTLWEIMVDSVFGNQKVRSKTLYGKTYHFTSLKGKEDIYGFPTQHDTIYEDEERILIIDAKMYGRPANVLSEDVLGKQFGYYLEAKAKKPEKKIINILFLPQIPFPGRTECPYFQYDIITDPHAPQKGEPGYDPDKFILLYEYPAKDLIDDYYFGRKRCKCLLSQFEEFIKDADVQLYLEERGCSF